MCLKHIIKRLKKWDPALNAFANPSLQKHETGEHVLEIHLKAAESKAHGPQVQFENKRRI